MPEEPNFHKTRSVQLARLMALDGPDWSDSDLAEMLRHQLEVEMVFDAHRLKFGELLDQSNPSEKSLRMIKDFFKTSRADQSSALPQDVSTLLYYTAIVAARVRLNAKITHLNDNALKLGIDWSLERSWISPQLKELFLQAKTIDTGPGK